MWVNASMWMLGRLHSEFYGSGREQAGAANLIAELQEAAATNPLPPQINIIMAPDPNSADGQWPDDFAGAKVVAEDEWRARNRKPSE